MRLERNPSANKFVLPDGYEDLGWQLWTGHSQWHRLVACRDAKHVTREFDNSIYRHRCTNVVTICDECKYVYHTDMSD